MSNPHRKARRAKRNKPYRPREIRTPMIVGTDLVLRPLEQIIDRLEIDGIVDVDGLRELVIAFRYCVPVQASTMAKLRAALPVLRRAMAMADPDDQVDILRQTQIKAELEARA